MKFLNLIFAFFLLSACNGHRPNPTTSCEPQPPTKHKNWLNEDLHTVALSLDKDDNVYWKNNSLQWGLGYRLDSYIDLWLLTGRRHWLNRFRHVSAEVLAQRTPEGVWPDPLTNYAYVGYTGTLLQPLMRYVALNLPGHKDYLRVFKLAHKYHEFEYDGQTYKFGPTAPNKLAGKRVPQNMGCLMAEAVFWYYKATGKFGDRVYRFNNYLSGRLMVVDDGYMWTYSSYASRIDDIGHANFTVRYMVRAQWPGWALTRLASTLDRLVTHEGHVIADKLDGSCLYEHRRTLSYWPLVTNYYPGLEEKLRKHLEAHGRGLELVQFLVATNIK